jgi:hypothetical protein
MVKELGRVQLPKKESAIMNEQGGYNPDAALAWRTSSHICALSDGERHVGHVVRIGGRWHAYDAMHPNETGDGFRSLGTYVSPESAKGAVEQSYLQRPLSYAGAA